MSPHDDNPLTASFTDQRREFADAEAASDFIADFMAPFERVESGTNEVHDLGRQQVRQLGVSGALFQGLDQSIHGFPGPDVPAVGSWRPVRAVVTTTGPRDCAEIPVQRIDQNRQVGLAGVAGSDENGQRAQINLGLSNGPEVRHLEFKIGLFMGLGHLPALQFFLILAVPLVPTAASS